MPDRDDVDRLNELERRLNALETQGGQGGYGQGGYGQGGYGQGGYGQGGPGQGGAGQGVDPTMVHEYLQGALIANALSHAELQRQGVASAGAAPAFLSLFSCGQGGGGPSPTNYDSFFICRSRFVCNPQSISCLC